MSPKNPLDPQTLNKLKQDLQNKLALIFTNHQKHQQSIGQEVPIDNEEAASIIEEIELSQKEDLLESKEAEQIASALKRIENGTYGTCELCDGFIGIERLTAIPSAKLCIQCQSDKEKK